MPVVDLDYVPRDYQRPFMDAMTGGCLNACWVAHRRSGKDLSAWNLMIAQSTRRVGNYFYYFPTGEQGRRILWDGKTRDGRPFLDYIPGSMIKRKSETRMTLDLINGSHIQVLGTDDVDRAAIGTSAHGAVFSEYAIQDPEAARYIAPILQETGGWTVYVFTPRGYNHGYDLYNKTLELDTWFTEKLTILDTNLLVDSDLDQFRGLPGYTESFLQQEYYCSFDHGLEGAIFGDALAAVRREGRVTHVPYNPALSVATYWDIGRDMTAIWFIQDDRAVYRVIDYLQNTRKGLPFYAKLLQSRPYLYGAHVGPHDIAVTEWGADRSRIEMGADLGIDFEKGYRYGKEDQVNATQVMLSQCVFDEVKTREGLHALGAYDAEIKDDRGSRPVTAKHNWASHGTDAYMLFATHPHYARRGGYGEIRTRQGETEFDPYTGESLGLRDRVSVVPGLVGSFYE